MFRIWFLASVSFVALAPRGVSLAQDIFQDPLYGVSVQQDILFGTGAIGNPQAGEIDLLLDLYEPVGANVPQVLPGMVYVHGGGWTGGNKGQGLGSSLPIAYAAYGYRVLSINYRLLGDDPTVEPGPAQSFVPFAFPERADAVNAAINDTIKAVNWVHANAAALGIDPHRLAIAGNSAGSVNSLFTAYQELGPQTEVTTVVDLWGAMYGQEFEIDADDPPLFIVHGVSDPAVQFSLAIDLRQQALAVGIPVETYFVAGGHGIDLETEVNGLSLFDHSINFLDLHTASLPPLVTGDANGDGTVGPADYTIWAAEFGQSGPGFTGDFSGNGMVGAEDYGLWADHFGMSASAASSGGAQSVPETSTGLMAALALFVAAASCRGRG